LSIVKNARLLGYVGEAARSVNVSTLDRGDLRFTAKKYSDGEINFVNLDVRRTKGSHAVVRQRLASADDIVELLLLVENLRHYGAYQIDVEIEDWQPADPDDHLVLRGL